MPLHRCEVLASRFFFLRRLVSSCVHHLFVCGKGLLIGTTFSIVDLRAKLIALRASLNSVSSVSLLGSLWVSSVSRWPENFFQSVAQKLRVGFGTVWMVGRSSTERMGRWSVLGPRNPGLILH